MAHFLGDGSLAFFAVLPLILLSALASRRQGASRAVGWMLALSLLSSALVAAYFLSVPMVGGLPVELTRAGPRIFPVAAGPNTPSLLVVLSRLGPCLLPIAFGALLARFSRGRGQPMRTAAYGALGTSMVALLLALLRSSSPSPTRYLSSLEPVDGPAGLDEPFRLGDGEFRIRKVLLTRSGEIVSWAKPDPALDSYAQPRPACALEGPAGTFLLGVGECWAEYRRGLFRIDRRGDYVVHYQPFSSGFPYFSSPFGYPRPREPAAINLPADADGQGGDLRALAFRTSDGAQVVLDAALVGDRLAPPRELVFVCGAGVAAALFFLVLAARARRRAGDVEGREAAHLGDGKIELDGEIVHVAAARALRRGPVLLTTPPTQPKAPFRDLPRIDNVRPGTLAAARAEHTGRAGALERVAFAAALIGAMPLLALHGLGM